MYQIAYANSWVRRVDGARRQLTALVALPAAIGVILLAMIGGPRLYTLAGVGLAGSPALDRALLYGCVMVLFYAVAGGFLVYEHRSREAANFGLVGQSLLGLMIGFGGFAAAVGVSSFLGAIGPGASVPPPLSVRIEGMAIGGALIAFQSFGEEFFFRGWLQPVLSARLGPWIGIGVTSILFAVAHTIGRPIGALAVVNDTLAGVLFGLVAFRSGGLIAPFAAHFAWNWAEQCVAGLTPNPGVDPLGSLFDLDLVGNAWMSGGKDELNGTLPTAGVLILMIAVTLLIRPRRRPGE